jgi:hypothetical protein
MFRGEVVAHAQRFRDLAGKDGRLSLTDSEALAAVCDDVLNSDASSASFKMLLAATPKLLGSASEVGLGAYVSLCTAARLVTLRMQLDPARSLPLLFEMLRVSTADVEGAVRAAEQIMDWRPTPASGAGTVSVNVLKTAVVPAPVVAQHLVVRYASVADGASLLGALLRPRLLGTLVPGLQSSAYLRLRAEA